MAKNIRRESKFPELMGDLKPTHTQEYTHTPTHTHEEVPVKRERKTRRVQMLMTESSVKELDEYAMLHDTSRTKIVQELVDKFLKEHKLNG